MPSCTHFKTFMLVLGLAFVGTANSAFSASYNEPKLEELLLPLENSPQFTFTMSEKSRVNFYLLINDNTKTINSSARITISDQDCTLGHQVSISYKKTSKETLTVYFPKEIPWGTTYKLGVSQDAKTKTLTFSLNGETISVTPQRKAEFIHLIKYPETINMLNIEQNQQ